MYNKITRTRTHENLGVQKAWNHEKKESQTCFKFGHTGQGGFYYAMLRENIYFMENKQI